MSEHKEPWELAEPYAILDHNREIILVADRGWGVVSHLRRIVACVNACRGLSIENLENPKYVACLMLDPDQLESAT